MKIKFFATLAIVLTTAFTSLSAQKTVVELIAKKNSLNNFENLIKKAGLEETLKGAGPFTVFAPMNNAFSALPFGSVELWSKPENKASLVKILNYHIVPGNIDQAAIIQAIIDGKGKAIMKTINGSSLTFTNDGLLRVTDDQGGVATIYRDYSDLKAGNGIVHSISKVLIFK